MLCTNCINIFFFKMFIIFIDHIINLYLQMLTGYSNIRLWKWIDKSNMIQSMS